MTSSTYKRSGERPTSQFGSKLPAAYNQDYLESSDISTPEPAVTMHNWRFLVIALLAAVQPIACFSERALADGRQCCERDAADVFPSVRHSHDRRKIGDRHAPSYRRETHLDERRYELKDHRLSEFRVSADRTRDAATSRERYTTYSDFDTQRRLSRSSSERVRDNRNNDGRSERFRERTVSLSSRRSEPDSRVAPVRDVRRDYDRQDSRSGGVLRQTRSIRVSFERESRNNEGARGREARNDVLRFDAMGRERRSASAIERREVTRHTREASMTRDNADTRVVRSNRDERTVRDGVVANVHESRRTFVRGQSSTRDSRRSYSLPSHRVQVVRRDLPRYSDDGLRERDDFRRISRQRSMTGDRQRSRSDESAAEHRQGQTNIRLLARERTEEMRATREQSVRSARNSLVLRRNDIVREERQADRSRLQRDTRLSAERDFTRAIRSSPREVRLDRTIENRNQRFAGNTDTRRVRAASLTRFDVPDGNRIDSRYRSHPELNSVETRAVQRMSTTDRSKVAKTAEYQFLAENWKALAFYTLQGLYLCSVLFRVFSNTNTEKKKARIPAWWQMTRRAIKQD